MVTSPAGRHLMQCKQSERYCVVLHSAPDSDLSRHSPQDSNPGLSRPCGCRPPDLDSTRPRVDKAQGRAFRSRSVLQNRGRLRSKYAGFENPAEQQTESLCYRGVCDPNTQGSKTLQNNRLKVYVTKALLLLGFPGRGILLSRVLRSRMK